MTTHKLYCQVTTELTRFTSWNNIQPQLEKMVRGNEDFYEYTNDPDGTVLRWSYEAQGNDGFRRAWAPGQVLRYADVYIVCCAEWDS